jgi:phage tail-like protein
VNSERIRKLLPSVIARTATQGTPLNALLGAMQEMHVHAEDVLKHLDSYLDPRRAPDAFVPYLASWVDLDKLLIRRAAKTGVRYSLPTGTGRLRELSASAAMLSQWRGTRRGLEAFLRIATGLQDFKIEENVSGEANIPKPYHLRISIPAAATIYKGLIRRIVEIEKPAYVTYELLTVKSEQEAKEPGEKTSETDKVSVPDLKGDTPEQAQNALQKLGVKRDPNYGNVTTSNQSEIGRVGKQSPAPGTKVAKDTQVKILVANALPEPPPPPATKDCTYGPDTCVKGYVWREASGSDHVCVTPEVRQQVVSDNALAPIRRNPHGGPYGPDTCLQGYVWRDAFPDDHVCVLGATRNQAAADNAAAESRKSCK